MSDTNSPEFVHPDAINEPGNQELKKRIEREKSWGNFFNEGVNKIIAGEDRNSVIAKWSKIVTDLEDDSIKRRTNLEAAIDDLNTSDRNELVGNERKFLADLEVMMKTGGGLLYLDIDRFKQINDQLGHEQGDRMIEWFSNVVRLSTRNNEKEMAERASDEAYHLHGDEHAMLFPGVTNPEDLKAISERILDVINKSESPIEGVKPTASIGGTIVDANDGLLESIRKADMAMLKAKQNGRDQSFIAGFDIEPKAA